MQGDSDTVSVKIKLAGAWTTLIGLYIYADFLTIYRPGEVDEIRRGLMGPVDVSQGILFIASLIVIVPALMIVGSLVLRAGPNRWANLVLAVLYTLINIGNLVGEGWAYYILFGVLEIAVTGFIFITAWKWGPQLPRTQHPDEKTETV